jgi:glycosyltransferase involved in cell wall biosynthesis
MEQKFVTVIVPTYKDWKRLALCVEALANQIYTHFEVIIVNNDPADAVPESLILPAAFRIITEAKPGSYAARNAGLKLAKGEIIAFTDADCIPDKNWIQNAVEHLANNPTCSRIAGNISIIWKETRPTIAEAYNSIFAFPQQSHARAGTSVTGNMFTYKTVFDAIGLFDEKLLSLGDLDWGKRAHAAGFVLNYVATVIVKHPARSLAELISKEKRVGGGQGSMRKRKKILEMLSCIRDIRPRPGLIKKIYQGGTSLSLTDQFKVFLLRHYLSCVRAFEKFRVLQGKQPERA